MPFVIFVNGRLISGKFATKTQARKVLRSAQKSNPRLKGAQIISVNKTFRAYK